MVFIIFLSGLFLNFGFAIEFDPCEKKTIPSLILSATPVDAAKPTVVVALSTDLLQRIASSGHKNSISCVVYSAEAELKIPFDSPAVRCLKKDEILSVWFEDQKRGVIVSLTGCSHGVMATDLGRIPNANYAILAGTRYIFNRYTPNVRTIWTRDSSTDFFAAGDGQYKGLPKALDSADQKNREAETFRIQIEAENPELLRPSY